MLLAEYIRSTPFRIAIAYATSFAVSVVVLFGVVYWLVTDEIVGELRGAIDQDAGSLLTVYQERGAIGLRAAIEDRITNARDNESLYMLRDRNGDFVSGASLDVDPIVGWQELTIEFGPNSRDGDGAPEYVLARGVPVADAFFVVGRSLYGLTEVQEVLFRSLAWALGLTVLLALAGGIGLGRGALRRINTINRAFQDIKEGNLARRIPSKGTRDDMDLLVANINDMLGRIEQLMANLQQVTNDIAHDLRTPLGRLRQGLELARLKDLSVEEYRAAVDRAIEQTDTILETFSALLRIAQIESKVRRGRFAVVDLSEISNRVVEAYESAVEDAGQTLRADISPGVQVRGDKDLLTQMLANLIENATRHCPEGTAILVVLTNDAVPALAVTDTGPGIPADAREAVLRRFHRLEESRTTSGSGLGLALVKAIAELHNAKLTLSDNRPGLSVSVQFPRPADR